MRHNSFCIHSKTSFYAIDLNVLTKFFPYLEITKPRDAEKIDTPAYLQKVSKVSLFLSEDGERSSSTFNKSLALVAVLESISSLHSYNDKYLGLSDIHLLFFHYKTEIY